MGRTGRKMVIQSTVDYDRHKKEVHQVIMNKYGQKIADKFIEFYSQRYNKYQRSFIDYRLAFWLLDDYHYVKRVGTRWYAIVGVGGTGKSTFMKNIFYFFDETFNTESIGTSMDKFIENLHRFETIGSMKANVLDEPDDYYVAHSHQGKIVRKILGKARQQNLFLGICATDLVDIPPYIYRKIDGIFFLPYLGKYFFFKNRPKKGSYILQEIRKNYQTKGYKIFFELKKDLGCLVGDTHALSPLDLTDKKKYLAAKKKDYETDINKFMQLKRSLSEGAKQKSDREVIIENMAKKGLTDKKMGEYLGLSRSRVTQIRNKLEKKG